jgi:starvation-inducible DNA-binding protein
MQMNIGMNDKSRQEVGDALARLLADTYGIYLKTQNFHWNLSGSEFYSLHILFEKQYQELAEAIDEIAERIRALGFYVDASFTGFLKLASIKDSEQIIPIREMLVYLLQGHEIIIRELRQLSSLAEKQNDPATVDLCGRRLNVHEKFAWMLRSQL